MPTAYCCWRDETMAVVTCFRKMPLWRLHNVLYMLRLFIYFATGQDTMRQVKVRWLTVFVISSEPTGKALHHETSSYSDLCSIFVPMRNIYGVCCHCYLDSWSLKAKVAYFLQMEKIGEVSKIRRELTGEVVPLEVSTKRAGSVRAQNVQDNPLGYDPSLPDQRS